MNHRYLINTEYYLLDGNTEYIVDASGETPHRYVLLDHCHDMCSDLFITNISMILYILYI